MEKAICIVPLPLMDTVDNVHWICSQETGPLQWSIIGSGMPSALGLILQYLRNLIERKPFLEKATECLHGVCVSTMLARKSAGDYTREKKGCEEGF